VLRRQPAAHAGRLLGLLRRLPLRLLRLLRLLPLRLLHLHLGHRLGQVPACGVLLKGVPAGGGSPALLLALPLGPVRALLLLQPLLLGGRQPWLHPLQQLPGGGPPLRCWGAGGRVLLARAGGGWWLAPLLAGCCRQRSPLRVNHGHVVCCHQPRAKVYVVRLGLRPRVAGGARCAARARRWAHAWGGAAASSRLLHGY
jgi:hypothetical protein